VERPFIYPERISADKAQAVRLLVDPKEKEDTEQAWNVLYKWVREEGIVLFLKDVAAILEFNRLDPHAQAKLLSYLAILIYRQ